MKTSSRRGRAAFTLIELMAVITIIVILASLVVGGMSFVRDRQDKERAKVQMALLSKALEDYKLDNGAYPATTDKTGTFTGTAGTGTSSILFNALYYVPATANTKIYVPELDPASSKQGWTTTPAGAASPILDPWGNQYCYRTATNPSGTANTATSNPDFDLWSMGKDGKSNPASPTDPVNRDDIKSP